LGLRQQRADANYFTWMGSALISASLATFRLCRLRGERCRHSVLQVGQTAWWPWRSCALPNSLMFPSGFSAANSNVEIYIVGAGEYEQGKQGTDEQRQVNLIDNLSVVKRSHELKFGVDYRRLPPFSSPVVYAQFAE
jgi:hypothetical protein